MGLSIAVFVPEGIVVTTDGLAELRNSDKDQGFLHKKLKRLFVFQNRFIICMHGNGFVNGLPCAYYIEKVFAYLAEAEFPNLEEFAKAFEKRLATYLDKDTRQSFYVLGMDNGDSKDTLPNIILSDNGQLIPINRGKDNQIVYNYHSVGRSLWLNKLLLPTSYTIDQEKQIDFDSVDIDFSKYSLEDAVDFSKTFFRLSRELDNIAQVKQMVGEYLTIGILTLDGNVVLKSYNADL
jgi:hypothetical protein